MHACSNERRQPCIHWCKRAQRREKYITIHIGFPNPTPNWIPLLVILCDELDQYLFVGQAWKRASVSIYLLVSEVADKHHIWNEMNKRLSEEFNLLKLTPKYLFNQQSFARRRMANDLSERITLSSFFFCINSICSRGQWSVGEDKCI